MEFVIKVRYKVISSGTYETFQQKINALMVAGWKPLGGVSVTETGFHQAMVKN